MVPRCVECGQQVTNLLTEAGRSGVVLAKCTHCAKEADPYLEAEYTILCLNLILCKIEAYRHLVFNSEYGRSTRSLVHLTALVVFLDASLLHCGDLGEWCMRIMHTLVIFWAYAFGCHSALKMLNQRCGYGEIYRVLLLSSIARLGAPMILVW